MILLSPAVFYKKAAARMGGGFVITQEGYSYL